MFNKIKELKNLRDQAKQMKEALAQESVKAEAEGGKITIIMDGNMEILSVNIDLGLLDTETKDKLEQGIKEAVNRGIKQTQRLMAQKMQAMGNINLPGLS